MSLLAMLGDQHWRTSTKCLLNNWSLHARLKKNPHLPLSGYYIINICPLRLAHQHMLTKCQFNTFCGKPLLELVTENFLQGNTCCIEEDMRRRHTMIQDQSKAIWLFVGLLKFFTDRIPYTIQSKSAIIISATKRTFVITNTTN